MKRPIFLLLVFPFFGIAQQPVNIIPQPVSVKYLQGNFVLSANTSVHYNVQQKDVKASAEYLASQVKNIAGFVLPVNTLRPTTIQLSVEKLAVSGEEAYTLDVAPKKIAIKANTKTGIIYGIQTLLQAISVGKENAMEIPCMSITDYPRFKYRGMHLDVGRHFYPVSFIKKYINFLATYKFNYFHWHLTEDQGWRIEIKKYPRLTDVGAWRNGTIIGRYPGRGNDKKREGGFYTQEEVKDVVKYAAERFINIVPEIEMPGHGSAAIAAYPYLSCFPSESTFSRYFPKNSSWNGDTTGKQVQQTWGVFEDVFAPTDYTFNFLQDVLNEVTGLFPSKYIHIGGDECPKDKWKQSAYCQQKMRELKLQNEDQLQSWFTQQISDFVKSKGRNIIGWDEILNGDISSDAAIMSWRLMEDAPLGNDVDARAFAAAVRPFRKYPPADRPVAARERPVARPMSRNSLGFG